MRCLFRTDLVGTCYNFGLKALNRSQQRDGDSSGTLKPQLQIKWLHYEHAIKRCGVSSNQSLHLTKKQLAAISCSFTKSSKKFGNSKINHEIKPIARSSLLEDAKIGDSAGEAEDLVVLGLGHGKKDAKEASWEDKEHRERSSRFPTIQRKLRGIEASAGGLLACRRVLVSAQSVLLVPADHDPRRRHLDGDAQGPARMREGFGGFRIGSGRWVEGEKGRKMAGQARTFLSCVERDLVE